MKLKIAYDKQLHLLAGFGFAAAGGVISPVCGFCLAFLAGLAKELYDLWDYGQFDWRDLAATCCGGIAGALLMGAAQWIS